MLDREQLIEKIIECAKRIVLGADDRNYWNNRCTVELDDVEEIELWLEDYMNLEKE